MLTSIDREAPPCASCKTTGGYVPKGRYYPLRRRTDRYGLPGLCCSRCAADVKRRHVLKNQSFAHTQAGWIELVRREQRETPLRVAAVRQAKLEKARRFGWMELTPEELAALVLPGDAS